jgi:hypothetical protein
LGIARSDHVSKSPNSRKSIYVIVNRPLGKCNSTSFNKCIPRYLAIEKRQTKLKVCPKNTRPQLDGMGASCRVTAGCHHDSSAARECHNVYCTEWCIISTWILFTVPYFRRAWPVVFTYWAGHGGNNTAS